MSRGLRFVSVGAGGFIVHAATLQGLVSVAGLPYIMATAVAVEASILHNFLWHERWTWADRRPMDPTPPGDSGGKARGRASRLARFLRFNGVAALVSIGGNVALMSLLVDVFHLPLLAAMALAVAALSAVNFTCADRLVFTE